MKKYLLTTKSAAVYILGGVLALALLMPVDFSRAQTMTDLQLQINELLATIAALKAQIGDGSGSQSFVCPYVWNHNLGIGATGFDVLRLQQFLNNDPATRLGLSGAGSVGRETQYYGPITASAVSRFQAKYASEVLLPLGLVHPTGVFGPSSRAKANALCLTAPSVPDPSDPDEDSEDDVTEDENDLRGGEATLSRFKTSSGEDTSLEENQQDVEIMNVEFRAEDGDVRISRIDVAFEHVSGDEDDPWDTFEEVSLWVDGERVARESTDSKSDWSEDSPYTGAHKMRFSGLDLVVRDGETFEFSVGVTLVNSIDGAEDGVSWNVFIPSANDGIRARDGIGVDHYVGSNNETVNVDINEEGSNDELSIRSSSEDPDATTLHLERNRNSDWHTVFAFELDTDDSENDIIVTELPISLSVSSSTVDTFMRDVRLVIDGDIYSDVTITDGATNSMIFEFDDGDVRIDSGDRVTVEVEVEFRSLAEAYEGVTIQGSVDADDIEAEGADDLSTNQLSGAATGDLHSLRTEGGILDNNNTSATLRVNASNDITDDEGVFRIVFEVEAFNTDLFINRTTASGTAMGTAGANFLIEDTFGDPVSDGSFTSALTSNASIEGNQFRVREGQTRTFTLNVNYDPTVRGFYRLQLHSFNFATSPTNPTIQQLAVPEYRFETDPVSI